MDDSSTSSSRPPLSVRDQHHNHHHHHTEQNGNNTLQNRGWRRLIRNASPQLFTITMGSGIAALLFTQFPYPATWLYRLSIACFALHVILVLLLSLLSLLRYTLYPSLWTTMLHHPTESLYLGAFPVSLLSLSNLLASLCAGPWGRWAAYTAWGLWMLGSVLAVATTAHIPLLHFPSPSTAPSTPRPPPLSTVTPAHLLPAIAAIVAANTAAPIASALPPSPNHSHATSTIIAGYVLWGIGVPTSLLLLTLYFARLLLHGRLPSGAQAVIAFITIGPLNMGASGIVQLGSVAVTVFPPTTTGTGTGTGTGKSLDANTLQAVGILVALVLWGWGLVWLWWAVGNVSREALRSRRSSPQNVHLDDDDENDDDVDDGGPSGNSGRVHFNMTYWASIFPLGTLALSSGRLAQSPLLPGGMAFFRVVCAAISALVWLVFVGVGGWSIWDLWERGGRGVFVSAVVADLEGRERESEVDSERDFEGGGAGEEGNGNGKREGQGEGETETEEEARTLTNEESHEMRMRRKKGE
ncbi:uncharacterized protein HMPREF1541_06236 [Cyphellophora europaea CBS 101466]|uniref:Sulfite efflux pump SSU1 n=1 Tax=Cyphellophora europaea (strain CBS 101466) TaxID=1220924 RepID=W2RPF2_CYPE1|nr:uncharacterized protein HMPREF1541_06236 [Cyphellophora europaea CBS 101466]ETN38205.1 hypothetical protein HMPREF1541_06236 [Cyphellophora europaea CBS 101466]